MFNLTLKMRETLLFFLIVMINGLICIDSDIGLDTCANGGEGRRCFFLQSLTNQKLKSP